MSGKNRVKSKVLLMGVCVVAVLSSGPIAALAQDKDVTPYNNIKVDRNATPQDDVQFKYQAAQLWKDISAAALLMDINSTNLAKGRLVLGEDAVNRIAQVSDSHIVNVPVRAGRIRYMKAGQVFEYFFPLGEDRQFEIDNDALTQLRDDNGYKENDVDIGVYDLQIDPPVLKDRLESIIADINDGNSLDAQTKLDALQQGLFSEQQLQDDISPRKQAIDWINLGRLMVREDHFQTLHYVLTKLKPILENVKQGEGDYSPHEDIQEMLDKVTQMDTRSVSDLRNDSVGVDVALQNWAEELKLAQ